MTLRPDQTVVTRFVPDGSRVLDLGCGHGSLMRYLMDRRDCTGTGVEIAPDAVVDTIAKGVPLIELDIDHQLDQFGDKSYDVVILSRVLQATYKPRDVLTQMARIGSRCIVSVPNFGYWRHRWVLMRGRMPMSKELPHAWYDTPNIHLSTLSDLEDLFDVVGLDVWDRQLSTPDGRQRDYPARWANLLAANAIYVLTPRAMA
ncbi:methionine biosynthesis protein MetW [Raineyella sp. LH-20]|uniref:methionine biosynthesis protein MetW n=1 Tax=Raineyella sp. LH-20 TaxID=3081204 RepID=UPI002953480A|nr:methionine biosynthesis protein MetW [Raineyella sp. LH-20]WOP18224.1 methionine biosynthesis protein MetW [Raineyella sp. LH-20]